MIFLGREKRSAGQEMLLFSVVKGVDLVNHPRVLDGQLRHRTDSIFLLLVLNKKTFLKLFFISVYFQAHKSYLNCLFLLGIALTKLPFFP